MEVVSTQSPMGVTPEVLADPPKAKPAKKKRTKSKKRFYRSRYGRRYAMKPGEREWRLWSHDFDAAYEALLKNPAAIRLTPKQLIARCEKIADAYAEMQTRRCPKGVERGF